MTSSVSCRVTRCWIKSSPNFSKKLPIVVKHEKCCFYFSPKLDHAFGLLLIATLSSSRNFKNRPIWSHWRLAATDDGVRNKDNCCPHTARLQLDGQLYPGGGCWGQVVLESVPLNFYAQIDGSETQCYILKESWPVNIKWQVLTQLVPIC